MKLGVLFDDFLKNDKNYYLMKAMNEHVAVEPDNVCAFVISMSNKIIPSLFGYMGISDIAHFEDGVLIATTLNTADLHIVVRSQLQADLLKHNFNIEVDAIQEDFNLEKLNEVCT